MGPIVDEPSSRVCPASGALRAGLGVTAGILATGLTAVVLGTPLIMFVLPYVPEPLAWLGDALALAAAFLLGGATSRRVAGPAVSPGWIGATAALAFLLVLWLLPEWSWHYDPHRGWAFVAPQTAQAAQRATASISPLGVVLMGLAMVVGITLAWLGDRWVARSLLGKRQ